MKWWNRVSGEWVEGMPDELDYRYRLLKQDIGAYRAKTTGHAKKAAYMVCEDDLLRHYGPQVESFISDLSSDWDKAAKMIEQYAIDHP